MSHNPVPVRFGKRTYCIKCGLPVLYFKLEDDLFFAHGLPEDEVSK